MILANENRNTIAYESKNNNEKLRNSFKDMVTHNNLIYNSRCALHLRVNVVIQNNKFIPAKTSDLSS